MFGGTFSIMHWLVVLAVVVLLFGGRGKVSSIMGDFGKGLRNFKQGVKDEDAPADEEESPFQACLQSRQAFHHYL